MGAGRKRGADPAYGAKAVEALLERGLPQDVASAMVVFSRVDVKKQQQFWELIELIPDTDELPFGYFFTEIVPRILSGKIRGAESGPQIGSGGATVREFVSADGRNCWREWVNRGTCDSDCPDPNDEPVSEGVNDKEVLSTNEMVSRLRGGEHAELIDVLDRARREYLKIVKQYERERKRGFASPTESLMDSPSAVLLPPEPCLCPNSSVPHKHCENCGAAFELDDIRLRKVRQQKQIEASLLPASEADAMGDDWESLENVPDTKWENRELVAVEPTQELGWYCIDCLP